MMCYKKCRICFWTLREHLTIFRFSPSTSVVVFFILTKSRRDVSSNIRSCRQWENCFSNFQSYVSVQLWYCGCFARVHLLRSGVEGRSAGGWPHCWQGHGKNLLIPAWAVRDAASQPVGAGFFRCPPVAVSVTHCPDPNSALPFLTDPFHLTAPAHSY